MRFYCTYTPNYLSVDDFPHYGFTLDLEISCTQCNLRGAREMEPVWDQGYSSKVFEIANIRISWPKLAKSYFAFHFIRALLVLPRGSLPDAYFFLSLHLH